MVKVQGYSIEVWAEPTSLATSLAQFALAGEQLEKNREISYLFV